MKVKPKPLSQFEKQELKKVRAVFFDIDDTFSLHGKILPEAFDALWKLKNKGIKAIPVTGRPAGWCDFISRMWPVSGVVGENGAFYQRLENGTPFKLKKYYLESQKLRISNAKRLENLKQELHRNFKGIVHPSDQPYREFDLAIDYCEDVKPWSEQKIKEVMKFCSGQGATVKLSSIHINVWYGRYDKWSCVKKVMQLENIKNIQQMVYLGDSPNDEPFFKELPKTVGVANVKKFLPKMQYFPAFITKKPGGLGFAEFVKRLLESHP